MDNFLNVSLIGEGTYGKVYKAVCRDTKEEVAAKRIPVDYNAGVSLTTVREIRMLKKLRSKYVVALRDVFFEEGSIYLIMEFLPFDLTGLVQGGHSFSDEQLHSLAHQLLEAAHHIHSFGLIHRDIKPSNILVDRRGQLKLADFGLTRDLSKLMTNRVCTLWYRAPELLLGAQSYDTKVDSWSIGCVLVEMRMKRPLFKGSDEISQVKAIFESLGAPPETYMWSEMLNQAKYSVRSDWDGHIEHLYGAHFRKEMLFLVGRLLMPSPKERFTVYEARKFLSRERGGYKLVPIDLDELHEHYCKRGRTEEPEAAL